MMDGILSGLLRSTVAVNLAAVAAWLLVKLLKPRSPTAEKFLWLFVLLQAACWQSFGLAVLEPPAIQEAANAPANVQPVSMTDIEESLPPFPLVNIPADASKLETATPSPPPALAVAEPSKPWPWKELLAGLWFVGTAAFLLRGAFDYGRLRKLLQREGAPPPDSWIADWMALPHAGIKLVATNSLGPMLIQGFGGAVVALPREFGDSLKPTERRAVFAHEIGHHRGFDPLLMFVGWLAAAVQWFNPFAWLASRRFHAASELACDARLDADARLLSLGQSPRPLALSMSGGGLAARIRALAQPQPKNEPRWKTALLLTVVFTVALGGWIRLEARPAEVQEAKPKAKSHQPPKEKVIQPPDRDLFKEHQERSKKKAEDDLLNRAVGKKSLTKPRQDNDEPDEPLPQAIRKAEERLKQLDGELRQAKLFAKGAADDRTATLKDFERLRAEQKLPPDHNRRIERHNELVDEAQLAASKKSVELDRLRRKTNHWREDLADQQKKLGLLWFRNLRQTSPEDDDASVLEKTLGYLAAREPKFGLLEVLPYNEHPETEAVLKLEALLKRPGLKPKEGETARQALERVLQTPPTEARKRFAEMRTGMKALECLIAMWEDRRDYWLGIAADLFESVEKSTLLPTWQRQMRGAKDVKHDWVCTLCINAAVRLTPGAEIGNAAMREERGAGGIGGLLWRLLQLETICKGGLSVRSSEMLWNQFHLRLDVPATKRLGDDRSHPLFIERFQALLEAAKAKPEFAQRATDLRKLADRTFPGRGLDELMKLEGKTPFQRQQFFLNRPTTVNFQGRGFANAFEELRAKSAAPLVVTPANWEPNLRPITLNAEAKWIDVLREVTRQAELNAENCGTFVLVRDAQDVNSRGRLLLANQRANEQSLPISWTKRLNQPVFLNTSETPSNAAVEFLSTQTALPILIVPDPALNSDAPITIDIDGAPLAVALEAAAIGIGGTWQLLEDGVILTGGKGDEYEKKAQAFRELHQQVKKLADDGNGDAKRLLQKTFIDFSETPLRQGVSFLMTQHGGGEIALSVKDKDKPVSINITGVSLLEGLHLLAWANGLTIAVEGTKVTISDK
jgi:beta-lactamase regulating signal transducer with metallopeptidase domain